MQQAERDLPAQPQEHAKERLDQPPGRKRVQPSPVWLSG